MRRTLTRLLDALQHVSHNRRHVKRFGLVLFVCLGLQLSTASAPFLHLHAADTTAQHDGPTVHRHLAAHTNGNAHEHEQEPEPETSRSIQADGDAFGGSAVEASALAIASGELSAGPQLRGVLLAAPERTAETTSLPASPGPPHDDVGRLIAIPDLDSPSLRGPPR